MSALEEMTAWVEEVADSVDSEVVVRFLAKKGWNEKNFQVSGDLGIAKIITEESMTLKGFDKTIRDLGHSCGTQPLFWQVMYSIVGASFK